MRTNHSVAQPALLERTRQALAIGTLPLAVFSDQALYELEIRIRRLESGSAWAEDPPSHTRHFVSNLRVQPGQRHDEVMV
jgi:3-phenylpropionate/cinnamic acid dioxygenase small subunit